jgi:tripartite-type tricarboxylate transporter receptor subunit TctC
VSDVKFSEWREAFLTAGRTKEVQDAYKVDFCQSNNQMTDAETVKYYQDQIAFWKRLSQGISLK